VCKENVLRLQITVDDFVLLQQQQTAEELLGEPSYDLEGETSKGVRLDELVKIHIQKFGGNAQMATEIKALCEADHTMLVFRILGM